MGASELDAEKRLIYMPLLDTFNLLYHATGTTYVIMII
jgi:hypothetical protein